ncbi:BREX-2 system adenine-specific DNA-methyltransferase PglX [Uniformispora flossi]|uniref:BREX-2 system adenine-specific DNA-methyltransferase PglX n=1 Tax=Uniformispora flossi TaxID=3390723 RepID=UPI003C2D98D3
MIKRQDLLSDLQKQVKTLETDLREQVDTVSEVYDRLRPEYDRAFKFGRTAATWSAWRDERVTQAAVAWVLGTVFVRFCEDNGLLPEAFLAGPNPDRMAEAMEAQEQFFRDHPAETDRGWLLASFSEIGRTQAGHLLFDERHNALYQIPLSHDAAKELIKFWRRSSNDAFLVHDFTDPEWDTRFLGDLYQDLSESARKTYALLQTPEFVEEFILDHTLTPAIEEFGYDVVKMIDPTCGSGHFVLGAFHRLLADWEKHAPGRDIQQRVRLSLEAVHGVDINPFAAAIARFRLLVAAFQAVGVSKIGDAAQYILPINIAIGDSLIRSQQLALFSTPGDDQDYFAFSTDDVSDYYRILQSGRYHAVVGNPPYVTVKDRSLNKLYRELYDACSGSYSLSVPFSQRFFDLAIAANHPKTKGGYVGQITAQSFMKREFGKKLIEEYFREKVELTLVVDSSGAYIPGHGTPTVMIFGRRNEVDRNMTVRTVLGIQGEPSTPENPRDGHVWNSIVSQVNRPGTDSAWTSTRDSSRSLLATHPWNLTGGGAVELQALLEKNSEYTLGSVSDLGAVAVTRENDAFIVGGFPLEGAGIPQTYRRPIVAGDSIRDWSYTNVPVGLWPYQEDGLAPANEPSIRKFLWPFRGHLSGRVAFGLSQQERGIPWTAYSMFFEKRFGIPKIAHAFVSTHNHFVLDREDRVFIQSAPVVVPNGSINPIHLLGVLNSSAVCFWLKQVNYNNGNGGIGGGISDEAWELRYQYSSTQLGKLPLPRQLPIAKSERMQHLADMLQDAISSIRVNEVKESTENQEAKWVGLHEEMIALQEEIDWEVYYLYGAVETHLNSTEPPPRIKLGERAFEIALARREARGELKTEWFSRHNTTAQVNIPDHWPENYRNLVEERIRAIDSNLNIRILERPEYKRRWTLESWKEAQANAFREWILGELENPMVWRTEIDGASHPRVLTAAQLADEFRKREDFVQIAEEYTPNADLEQTISLLIRDNSVPFLAALRFKEAGLRKNADWEKAWERQREWDSSPAARISGHDQSAPLPPKYASSDFAKTSYWKHRGKLDLAKERFISYPHLGRGGDSSPLIGSASWNHQERAQALAALSYTREHEDGWGAEELTPVLAGLRELMPWVKQWHGEFDPVFGDSPANVYEAHLTEMMTRLHLTEEDLVNWRPPKVASKRAKKK